MTVLGRAFGFKLGRFGIVGVISTLIYVVMATIGARWTALPIVVVNAVAITASGAWGYIGHYYLTFRSDAAHGASAARFFALFGLGYVASTGIVFLNQQLALPPELGTAVVTIFLPVMNFLVMQLWVFSSGTSTEPGP
jgi:putative flippase GtrA